MINFNIHTSIPLDIRLKTSELLNDFIRKELEANLYARIVCAGDFNSFPDWHGFEQMNMLKGATLNSEIMLTEVSDILYLPDGTTIPDNNTFIFFPFDYGPSDAKFKEEIAQLPNLEAQNRKLAIENIFKNDVCKALGGQLDHIFVHKLNKIGEAILDVAPQFEPYPTKYTENEIKVYILEHNQGPAFASDHQPIVVELIGN